MEGRERGRTHTHSHGGLSCYEVSRILKRKKTRDTFPCRLHVRSFLRYIKLIMLTRFPLSGNKKLPTRLSTPFQTHGQTACACVLVFTCTCELQEYVCLSNHAHTTTYRFWLIYHYKKRTALMSALLIKQHRCDKTASVLYQAKDVYGII